MEKVHHEQITYNHISGDIIQNFLNNKEIIRCVKCNEIPILIIHPKINKILIICPFHQILCDYSNFLLNCKFKCPKCFNPGNFKINDMITCNKCNEAVILNNEINNINICSTHINQVYMSFCLTCKKNLCIECNQHNHHYICNFLNSLLNNDQIKFIENSLNKKENLLNNLIK